MMTPQEAANSTFPKATLGGYNMAAVDVFLDKLTEDYTTLYKENAALKAKIKVLVDKMEEYHAMEDTMRSTLLTAQKMANTMVAEAEEKSAAMVADGEANAKIRLQEIAASVAAEELRLESIRREMDDKIAAEHERLAVAQRELSAFINASKKLCQRQMELIERLPELDILPAGFVPSEEIPTPEVPRMPEIPEPIAQENAADPAAEPADDGLAAAALAEVAEELGGDASSLMENMRNVIDSFAAEKESAAPEQSADAEETPFEIGFEDADSLFEDSDDDFPADEDDEDAPHDDFDEDDDPFLDEADENATRVLDLKDLQFGRNYNKDK